MTKFVLALGSRLNIRLCLMGTDVKGDQFRVCRKLDGDLKESELSQLHNQQAKRQTQLRYVVIAKPAELES